MRKGKPIYMFRVSGIQLHLWQEEATLIQLSLLNIKKVHKDHYRNVTCDIKNNKIIWIKVKHIQLRKEKRGSMFVKYDFSQEFMEIECTPKTRGKPKKLKTFNELPQKYNRRLAISIAKKEDLLAL